jgi:hypothetical protein
MSTTRRNDLAESLRLALDGLDTQIAELRETRAQLATLIDRRPASPAAFAAESRKRRKLSAAARAKISAAAKARWAQKKKARAKKQSPKLTAKKAQAQAQAKPVKARPAPAKAKKSPPDKGPI